ncbi:MAG: ATP-binding protein [Pseudomonadota bacterium]|nr:ATP-binding protein [Pseudomonadota bacterium]
MKLPTMSREFHQICCLRVYSNPLKPARTEAAVSGLWQAKRIMASLGGSITAVNVEDGGGAKFVVRLPLE